MKNFGNTPARVRHSYRLALGLAALCFAIAASPAQSVANDSSPMLYFFTADGCAPCIQVKHVVQQLQGEGYPVTTVNVDERPDWAKAFRVTHTPTLSLVRGKQVLAWQPRPMRAEELRGWFRTIGFVAPVAKTAPAKIAAAPAVRPVENKVSLPKQNDSLAKAYTSPTLHRGTRNPQNVAERNALLATVRLKVKDDTGTSYATGTVVHSHRGESLVLTCGHVFRDSGGRGSITAEFGFEDGTVEVPGELLDYDSQANDIALVAINNGSHPIEVAEIAPSISSIERGQEIFSVGCDRGEAPTIRHSAIKNLARYDGSLKYDIFGRPVNGRSGGGLFDEQGRLIGICNAAAVEVDEGIYTALEVIHHQIAKTNLDHLFKQPLTPAEPAAILVATNSPARISTTVSTSEIAPSGNMIPIARRQAAAAPERFASLDAAAPKGTFAAASSPVRNVALTQSIPAADDQEVLITIRSKSDPAKSKTIIISDPTPKLLDYLNSMDGQEDRSLKMARYRTWR